VFTFVVDALLFRLAEALRLVRADQHPTKKSLWRVVPAFASVTIAVYDDYRLNIPGLIFALTAYTLVGLSKVVPRIGPRIDNGSVHTWDCPLYTYLLTGIPPILITFFAAIKFENVPSAIWTAWSWGFWPLLATLAPGVALLLIFKSSMNTAYPSSPSVLENSNPEARTPVVTTLQSCFWITCIGVFLGEKNLVSWLQVLSFVLLYVVAAGPRAIGFYPPRLLNLFARIMRKPQQKLVNEPWQLPFFLCITISIFAVLFGSSFLYWNVDVAYGRDAKNWGNKNVNLDRAYVPPQPYLFDIVIAHSAGDPIESISELISAFAVLQVLQPNFPRVKIYTKDQSLTEADFDTNITAGFQGPLTAVVLNNSGGVTATYLHHILYSWDFLPTQTLFLTTSSDTISNLPAILVSFNNYFIPSLPIHSERIAEPTTSFLNLGEYSTCSCNESADEMGWEDTFHLIPSMYGAAYSSGSSSAAGSGRSDGKRNGKGKGASCTQALLTHGNNFIAGAERIRGLDRDVYQLLYDALTNANLRNGWAHDASKIPVNVRPGGDKDWNGKSSANSGGKDRPKGNGVAVDSFRGVSETGDKGKNANWWTSARGGIEFGEEDSLEHPYLGYTVERLWGILMQCSTSEIAWRCPNTLRGWRRGGERADCGCLVW
jgi:hypothetical protein